VLDEAISACHSCSINTTHTVAKTKHFSSRINQRGIREATVELAQKHGCAHGDKLILGRKQIRSVLEALDRERKELIRAMDKGGVIVVESCGDLITAYDFDSRYSY
jgi:hypothetical protein